MIVGGNLGWDAGRNVGASVDIYVFGKLGSGDDGGYDLKVEYEVYYENGSIVSKYVNM